MRVPVAPVPVERIFMAKKMLQISAKELRKMKAKIAAEERKKLKKGLRKVDGLGPHLKQGYVTALRMVWRNRSEARKICVRRADIGGGYSRCEGCKKKVPKVFIDHIEPCGVLDSGFIERLSCASEGLQALCSPCHRTKTNEDNARIAKAKRAELNFY